MTEKWSCLPGNWQPGSNYIQKLFLLTAMCPKNDSKKVDCAIIGCGLIAGNADQWGSNLVRTHAKAFSDHKQCRLVAVCDTDEEIARAFARKWGAERYGTHAEALLKECRPDIISICTPTRFHEEGLDIAQRAGASIIWIEKPAADNREVLQRMKENSKKYSGKIWVNYFRRYEAGFLKVKNSLAELGPMQQVTAYYTKGLRHNGSHMLDLLLWFFGSVHEVSVTSMLMDIEYPTVSGQLIMDKARVNLIGLDHNAFELFELDIIGQNGRIQIIDGGHKICFEHVVKNKFYKGYKNLSPNSIHAGSYSTFMRQGLQYGLAGNQMPGLDNELQIQGVLDQFSEAAGIVF
ncbi:Gfo/Idh/MocA family protein [Thermodesulfobacteriota bacterium]